MLPSSLIEVAVEIIDRRGKPSLDEATNYILKNCKNGRVYTALNYYATELLQRVMPIFPALINLSCEVVGGKPEDTQHVASAMMLITASGDIHDDIIDASTSKFGKRTILGKYGRDIALLAGDTMLFQGMEQLQQNLSSIQEDTRAVILNLITKAMFELSEAEATETYLWKKHYVSPEEYFNVIKHKGSIAELHCAIGALLGGANKDDLDNVIEYGRVIGILSTLKDEFMDVSNFLEIKNRYAKEILPYPFICAFQEPLIKKQVIPIIRGKSFSKKDVPLISKIILDSTAVQQVKTEMMKTGEKEIKRNPILQNNKTGKEAALLLQFLANEL